MYFYKVSENDSIQIYFKDMETDHVEYIFTMKVGSTIGDAIRYVNGRNKEL